MQYVRNQLVLKIPSEMEVPWLLPVSCHNQTRGHHGQYCNRNKKKWDKIWTDNNKNVEPTMIKTARSQMRCQKFCHWVIAGARGNTVRPENNANPNGRHTCKQRNTKRQNVTIQTQNTKGIANKAPPELIPTPIAAPMSPRVAKPPALVLSLTCCYLTVIILLLSYWVHTVIIMLSYCNHTVIIVVSKFVLIVQTGTNAQLFARHWYVKSCSSVLFSYLWTHTQLFVCHWYMTSWSPGVLRNAASTFLCGQVACFGGTVGNVILVFGFDSSECL